MDMSLFEGHQAAGLDGLYSAWLAMLCVIICYTIVPDQGSLQRPTMFNTQTFTCDSSSLPLQFPSRTYLNLHHGIYWHGKWSLAWSTR